MKVTATIFEVIHRETFMFEHDGRQLTYVMERTSKNEPLNSFFEDKSRGDIFYDEQLEKDLIQHMMQQKSF
jgi:GTP-sensing pleiotropic transcriptional regulator CodY